MPSRPCARSRHAPSDAVSAKSASSIQSRRTLMVCLLRVDGCAHASGGGTPKGTISCSWHTCVVSTRCNLGKQRVRMHHDIPLPYVNAHARQVWKASCMILCSPHDCSNNAFCMVFPTPTDAHILNDIFTILSSVLASTSPLLTQLPHNLLIVSMVNNGRNGSIPRHVGFPMVNRRCNEQSEETRMD